MTQPRYEYTLGAPKYPVLNGFMACREFVSSIMGPLGSGKTYGCLQRMMAHMVEQPPNAQGIRPSRWLAVRNTYPELMGTTWKDFKDFWAGLAELKMGGLEPPTYPIITNLDDGTQIRAEVIFLALDREDAVRKLRGYQLTGVWFNEMREIAKPIFDMAQARVGRYPSMASGGVNCDWFGIFGDTNAMDEDHWYYKLAEEDHPQGFEFFKQPGGVEPDGLLPNGRIRWKPNPEAENLTHLPDRYYIRQLEGKDDAYVRVNLANLYGFSVDGKPVHPEYVDSTHCQEGLELEAGAPLIVGVDFGRTPAAAICQYLQQWGRWIVIDEFVTENMSAAIFGPELKRYLDRNYPGYEVQAWGDPAGDSAGQATEDTPVRILRASGIPIQPCLSNAPALRRAAVARPATRMCMDGHAALLVSPKAKMIRKGLMGGYQYRRLRIAGTERYTDQPDKNEYSHPVEALEYALMGGGEGQDALRPAMTQRRARAGERRQRFART